MSDATTRRLAGPLSVLVGLALLTGCTDDGEPPASPPGAAPSLRTDGGSVSELRLAARPAAQRTVVRRVWGRWPDAAGSARTQRLQRQTGQAVARWMDRGFVDPAYPTGDFRGAFSTFTAGAAAQARRQDWLTTNRALGRRLVDVVPVRRTVGVVAFAPAGSAVGATASVALVLRGLGAAGRRSELAVTGELFLTRERGSWQIFGYDLQRSVGRPGSDVNSQDRRGRSEGE